MKLEEAKKTRIIKNALLSLALYALPLVLMFATFYFTGQRPWEKKKQVQKTAQPTSKTKSENP
jgi:preprotein translocase subunit YajC